ncbi:MAG: AAA family ATPase [Planctomycetota bacterium]
MITSDVLPRLQNLRETGDGKWSAKCPAHDDRHASLSIGTGNHGRVLMHCHAGCSYERVCGALGLDRATGNNGRRIVATYNYRAADGTLLYQTVRYEPKDFRARVPAGNGDWTWKLNGRPRVLYNLPALTAADPSEPVFVCEGEKDCDNLATIGCVTSCNVGGAGKWKTLSDDSVLNGRHICIIADADEPGRKHAHDVANRLYGRAADVRVIEVPNGKDASDWLDHNDSAEPEQLKAWLLDLAAAAPVFEPPHVTAADARPDSAEPAAAPIIIRCHELPEQPVSWLWHNRLEVGALNLVGGDPGKGKSLLTAGLAATVSNGGRWPDGTSNYTTRGGVLFLSAEDDPARATIPRLRAAGADLSRVAIVRAVTDPDGQRGVNLQSHLPQIEQALDAVGDVRLLILDPINSFIGRTDGNANEEVRAVLEPLAALAERRNICTIIVMHLNKAESASTALYRISGSMAYTALSRTVHILHCDPDDKALRLFMPCKVAHGPMPEALAYRIGRTDDGLPRIEWEAAPVDADADAIVANRPRTAGAIERAERFIIDSLTDGPMSSSTLDSKAGALGITSSTLRRAKERLRAADRHPRLHAQPMHDGKRIVEWTVSIQP